MKLLERDFLTQVGRLRVANIQQYYSLPKVKRIIGDKNTEKYQQSIDKAKAEGRYQEVGGQPYEITPRKIRLEGRKLVLKDNQVQEQNIRGYSFFNVLPTFVTGQLDVKIEAGATMPVSKALLQSKVNEFTQNKVILGAVRAGYYDMGKIADKLSEVNDFNPDDFKAEQVGNQGQGQEQPQQQQIDLANQENEGMMKGEQIGPTPYAEPGHTEIHIAFMKSPTFKQGVPLNDPRVQIFSDHVMGEAMAQQQRGQGQPGQSGGQAGQPPMGKGMAPLAKSKMSMGDVVPGRVMGGENTQPIAFSQGKGPGK